MSGQGMKMLRRIPLLFKEGLGVVAGHRTGGAQHSIPPPPPRRGGEGRAFEVVRG
jgi:hypothetical protein